MTTRKQSTLERALTDVELELMSIIWELGSCTVKDVQARLAPGRDLAYTSVATIMKILEQKGVLASRKSDRAHVYAPKVSRSEYEAASLRRLADDLFHGDPSTMVMRLLDEAALSGDELKAIRKLLDERLRK